MRREAFKSWDLVRLILETLRYWHLSAMHSYQVVCGPSESKTTLNPSSQSILVGSHLFISWWRHQMETFSALLAICAGNSPVPGEFRAQRPVTRSFDVFFDLRLNKRLSTQSRGWWFETLSCPLRRQCNVNEGHHIDGLVRDCSNSSAIAMELLQSCPNPSI